MKFKKLDYNLKLEENSYYNMKTIGIRQHDVMLYIKNKWPTWNRIDLFKKEGHEKYMHVDILKNVCKPVMTHTIYGTHTQELELVWLLKWYAEVMTLFLDYMFLFIMATYVTNDDFVYDIDKFYNIFCVCLDISADSSPIR